MACETCYAPSNWVPGEKLAAANESKREAFKELRALRDELAVMRESYDEAVLDLAVAVTQRDEIRADLAAERARAEREDEAHTRTIEQRDAFEEQIEAIYRALGGEGEWCAKLPPEDPPDSGDLGADALALAAAVIADRDRLRAAGQAMIDILRELHYGRMPERVQAAFDDLRAALETK